MKSTLTLASLAFAAVASLAWASTPSAQDPIERLAEVEREVKQLKLELANLRQGGGDSELAKQLAQDRADLQALTAWARAQGQAGSALQAVLADSRDKGFTAGINPASREVLLDGMQRFAESLKSELPSEPAPQPSARKRPEPVRKDTPLK